MSITIEDVKKNVAYKQLPIVILDERWHRLFPEKDKTPEVKRLERPHQYYVDLSQELWDLKRSLIDKYRTTNGKNNEK